MNAEQRATRAREGERHARFSASLDAFPRLSGCTRMTGAMDSPANSKRRPYAADPVVRTPVSVYARGGRGRLLPPGLLLVAAVGAGPSRSNPAAYGREHSRRAGRERDPGGCCYGWKRMLRSGLLRPLNRRIAAQPKHSV